MRSPRGLPPQSAGLKPDRPSQPGPSRALAVDEISKTDARGVTRLSDLCTDDQAGAALEYLRHAFGGFSIPDVEAKAHRRVFRSCTPGELRQAIDDLVLVADRRPSPNEIAQRVRAVRRGKAPDERQTEVWPARTPAEVSKWIAKLKQLARAGTEG